MVKPLDKDIGWARDLRGRMFSVPFRIVRSMTSWDIHGQDRLIAAVEDHQRTGQGLITVSNHVSLFDDPLVLIAALGVEDLSELTKCWYSTACADNFNPGGKSPSAKVTRWFSEISNMIFLSRAHKRGSGKALDGDPIEDLIERFDERLRRLVMRRAASLGFDLETYLQSFLTPWGQGNPPGRVEALNQTGLLEAVVRVDAGDWVHFFPEGGRSRDLSLRPARSGVGKVVYHAPEARVLPICFYGTQDVMPVGAKLPVPGKTVHVMIGEPIDASALRDLRGMPATSETYQAISELAMDRIAELRPAVLERYLGAERAAKLLLEEAQMRSAMGREAATGTYGGQGQGPLAEIHQRARQQPMPDQDRAEAVS